LLQLQKIWCRERSAPLVWHNQFPQEYGFAPWDLAKPNFWALGLGTKKKWLAV